MNPCKNISYTFTVEEWAMICKGILSMAAAVNLDELSDKDVPRMQYLIHLCNDFYSDFITKSFEEK